MSGTHVTWTGNLTRDPEVRFSQSGNAWSTFSIAVDHYTPNAAKGDTETTFVNVKVLNSDLATNLAESLTRGTRVIVTGQVKMEQWTDREGQPRTSVVLVASDVATSLRWATAKLQVVKPKPANRESGPQVWPDTAVDTTVDTAAAPF